jgi:hypothetical protein
MRGEGKISDDDYLKCTLKGRQVKTSKFQVNFKSKFPRKPSSKKQYSRKFPDPEQTELELIKKKT